MSEPQAVAEQSKRLLQEFVFRARRIEAHTLASDSDKLLAWAEHHVKVTVTPEKTVMRLDMPAEELTESLAARCRPLLLASESIHHVKVINALKFFARQNPDVLKVLESLRKSWSSLEQNSKEDFGYESMIGRTLDGLGRPVSARKLAYSWLYGDLVHADPIDSEKIGDHTLDSRFEAGAFLVCRITIQAIATLNLVRSLQKEAILPLDPDVFTAPVVARGSRDMELLRAFMAPAGTPMEEMYKAAGLQGPPASEQL